MSPSIKTQLDRAIVFVFKYTFYLYQCQCLFENYIIYNIYYIIITNDNRMHGKIYENTNVCAMHYCVDRITTYLTFMIFIVKAWGNKNHYKKEKYL